MNAIDDLLKKSGFYKELDSGVVYARALENVALDAAEIDKTEAWLKAHPKKSHKRYVIERQLISCRRRLKISEDMVCIAKEIQSQRLYEASQPLLSWKELGDDIKNIWRQRNKNPKQMDDK